MKLLRLLIIFMLSLTLVGCQPSDEENTSTNQSTTQSSQGITLDKLPEYPGEPFVALNDNIPNFDNKDKTSKSFETYSELDNLGRCGVAYANIGQDLMPTEDRGSISSVKPSGWKNAKYDVVDGKYLYNRCHLIGFQLAGENANKQNLITGTRYFNVEGMLPFENMVADYVKETNNHVLYRVTPIYNGDDLVARGVQIEAESVEDDGEGIMFNVFIYNVQPEITIDYSTGDSCLTKDKEKQSSTKNSTNSKKVEIRGNSNSKIYHCPGQSAYDDMKNSKYLVTFSSEKEAQDAGYRKAKR